MTFAVNKTTPTFRPAVQVTAALAIAGEFQLSRTVDDHAHQLSLGCPRTAAQASALRLIAALSHTNFYDGSSAGATASGSGSTTGGGLAASSASRVRFSAT